MTRWQFIRVVLLFLMLLGTAHAQSEASTKTARDYVMAGNQKYRDGEFEQALTEYEQAYRLDPKPFLLFNMAQANRKAGHSYEALSLYEQFLKAEPESRLAPEADARATSIREQIKANNARAQAWIAEQNAARAAAVAHSLESARQPEEAKKKTPVYKRWWLWVAIGVPVAALAVGLSVGLSIRRPDLSNGTEVRPFTLSVTFAGP